MLISIIYRRINVKTTACNMIPTVVGQPVAEATGPNNLLNNLFVS